MSDSITVIAGPKVAKDQIALIENDPAHPGGRTVVVKGGGRARQVARTKEVMGALADGRLVELHETHPVATAEVHAPHAQGQGTEIFVQSDDGELVPVVAIDGGIGPDGPVLSDDDAARLIAALGDDEPVGTPATDEEPVVEVPATDEDPIVGIPATDEEPISDEPVETPATDEEPVGDAPPVPRRARRSR